MKKPMVKLISPTLFIVKACIAEVLAGILVDQKLIKRKDMTPMNSQPRNIIK